MDENRIIDRVAKLLRIASRDPGPQGNTAKRIAKKLMAKHRIDVRLPEKKDTAEQIVFVVSPRSVAWRSKLLEGVAVTYGCTTKTTANKDTFWIWLNGDPQVLLRARAHYEFLAGAVEHLTDQYEKRIQPVPSFFRSRRPPRFDAKSFADGVSNAIHNRMTKKTFDGEHTITIVNAHDPENPVPAERSRRTVFAEPEFRGEAPTNNVRVQVDGAEVPYWAREGYRVADQVVNPRPYPQIFGGIEELSLPAQVERPLRCSGLGRVADLLRITPQELLSVKGIGHARSLAIEKALRRFGCALRPRRSRIS